MLNLLAERNYEAVKKNHDAFPGQPEWMTEFVAFGLENGHSLWTNPHMIVSALGMLQAGRDVERWLLVVATGAIAVFVANWIRRERSRGDSAALGLVLGGALGNITDRVRFGHVVDFIDVHIGGFRPFLVFNLADAAITIGVVMLLVHALFARDEAAKTETEDA